jgi:hypothetical protein
MEQKRVTIEPATLLSPTVFEQQHLSRNSLHRPHSERPLGTMETEKSLMEGGGSQQKNLRRWGDYSSMSVDPVDDCTFWYTNQYLQTSGTFNWSTRIGSFKFTSCTPVYGRAG